VPVRSVGASPTAQAPVVIPKLVTDPVASFRPWPINIRVGREQVTIPAMCASDWLDLLMQMEDLWLENIFPDLLDSDDSYLVEDALAAGKIGPQELSDIALDVIAAAGGRPWWVVMKLIGCIKANWDNVGGEFALEGVNPNQLSLAGWLDAALVIVIRHIDGNDQTNAFLMRLEAPPPGQEAPSQAVDVNTFMSMM